MMDNFDGFYELEEPSFNPYGWYVATNDRNPVGYLHNDLDVYPHTGQEGIGYPGYFTTEDVAIQIREQYYAKHTGQPSTTDAFDYAMKGI